MIDKIIDDCLSINLNIDKNRYKKLDGGLSNEIYLIETLDSKDKYIVRIFNDSKYVNREYENEIMYKLSKKRISPNIILKNNKYRVEQYLEGSTVDIRMLNLRDFDRLLINIAKRIFDIHNFYIFNFRYEENNIYLKIDIFFDILGNLKIDKFTYSIDDLKIKLEECKEIIKNNNKSGSSVNYFNMGIEYMLNKSLIHADLLSGNIICTLDNDIKFIDYEYSCIFSRGYDIGNFFNEFKGLDLELEYPSYGVRRLFYFSYFNTVNIFFPDQKNFNEFLKGVDHIVLIFSRISNLFWGLWSLVKYSENNIKFDYLNYGLKRIRLFNDNILNLRD